MVLYNDLNERFINSLNIWYGYVSYEVLMPTIYHIIYKQAPTTFTVNYSKNANDYYLDGELGTVGEIKSHRRLKHTTKSGFDTPTLILKDRSIYLSGKKQGVFTDAYKLINFLNGESIGKSFQVRESTKMFPLRNDVAAFVSTSSSDALEDDDTDTESVNRITLCGPNDKVVIDYFQNVLKPKIIEFSKKLKNTDQPKYQLAYFDGRSIRTTFLSLKVNIGEVKDNYNDDLPYERINELINSKKSELMLFYGEPGTGKTSLIKHLIKDNKDRPFIFIDGSLFSSISDGTFLSFITDNKDAVMIFEDCEKILMKRDESYNQNIGTLLNLTDGLMADEYTLKFIMTFNCPMDKIDEAIRRKGRLSLEYKFDKLKADKAHKINNKANSDITLSDLYNLEKEVSIGGRKRVKIGFSG